MSHAMALQNVLLFLSRNPYLILTFFLALLLTLLGFAIVLLVLRAQVRREKRTVSSLREEIRKFSVRDDLTKVYNYRYFQERFSAEFKRAKRSMESLTLMLVDIDYFSSINTTYGHAFGDSVLAAFAETLRRNVRENDVVFKYGDDEFGIILPATGGEEAQVLAQRLQGLIHRQHFQYDLYSTHIKVSVGYVSYPDDGIVTPAEFIQCAEQALRRTKERGGGSCLGYVQLYKENLAGQGTDDLDLDDIEIIKEKMSRLSRKLNQTYIDAVNALSAAVEAKDYYTVRHSDEVTRYSLLLAAKINLPEDRRQALRVAATLHDIGKIGISEKILLKPGPLTDAEYRIIKMHPIIGADIIKSAKFLEKELLIIRYHHENWDGTGYPDGLRGQDIPLEARIIAVTDVYSALISRRSYRKAFTRADAIEQLSREKGRKLDPHLTDLFIECLRAEEQVEEGTER